MTRLTATRNRLHLLGRHGSTFGNLLVTAVILVGGADRAAAQPSGAPGAAAAADPKRSAAELAALREKLDATLWSNEVTAQRHEETFIKLWDDLRASPDQWKVLGSFPFQALHVGELAPSPPRDGKPTALGLEEFIVGPAKRKLSADDFKGQLAALASAGYRLVETEWHHSTFDQPKDGPARSTVSMTLHVVREKTVERIVVKGKIDVEWSGKSDAAGRPIPAKIETVDVKVLRRAAPAAFEEILTVSTDEKSKRLMPLLVYDLNGDGLSEIVLGGLNRIYWNEGAGKFRQAPLAEYPVEMFDAAILADFTGDGHVDLVCVSEDRYPRIFEGGKDGKFSQPSRRCARSQLELPKSFTAGDIDGDGDLDLWIGQYKFPYVEGSMPTPFYDANDGFPSVLLVNDGKGNFLDKTDAAGLSKKRNRRTFSSSLVDLDDDRDLDLITVNDFCGFDVYANDGQGKFTDVTDQIVDQKHLFGMGHCFADFDGDGLLDIYGIGMSSTTARRLDHMKLGPADRADINAKRSAMGYGNRLMLGRENTIDRRKQRVYRQAAFNDQLCRTGWSWGTTAIDFDNDGDKDIFVTNGHSSGRSARDYCTRYWCHDVYTGTSQANRELLSLFGDSLRDLHRGEISWNGFEHDVLWMNDRGRGFADAAFPLGIAFEFDGRAAASDDLDLDGRPDLLVVEHSAVDRQTVTYRLHVLRNRLETSNNWIGVQLGESPAGSPIGARVAVTYPGGRQIARVVTGDSFSSQHAATVHFGLGAATRVEAIDIEWASGKKRRLEGPTIRRYMRATP